MKDYSHLYKPGGLNTCHGDLSKRWYFHYHYLNEKTGEWQFFKEYCGVNRIKNKRKREAQLQKMYNARLKLLDLGYNPLKPDAFSSTILETDVPEPEPEMVHNGIEEVLLKTLADRNTVKKYCLKSYQTHASRLKNFFAYLKKSHPVLMAPEEIKRDHMIGFVSFMEGKGLNGNYITNHIQTLHMLFEDLLDADMIAKNPCRKIHRIKEESEAFEPYENSEVTYLFREAMQRNFNLYLAMALLYYGGIRNKEARLLKVKSVNLNKGLITVHGSAAKNNKTQHVTIYPRLRTIMEAYLLKHQFAQPNDYLVGIDGKPGPEPVGKNYFHRKFADLREKLNIPTEKRLYALKHTAAVQLIEENANIYDIAKHFRHSKVEYVNERYLRGRGSLPTKNLDEKMEKALK